jgi:hypothetical protein
MKTDDSLSNVFGVAPVPSSSNTEVITQDGEIITPPSQKIEDDYDAARTNLRQLLLDGQAALQTALAVAQSSEHPRAFEVVGNLMKQLADINQQLLDIHQQKQKLDGPKSTAPSKVTNNAIFVGSTNELNKMIKNMNKGE